MKRLPRILFRAATILAAVLCLAAAAGWVRSYWRGDHVRLERDVREAEFVRSDSRWLRSARGSVAVGVWVYRYVDATSDLHRPWEWKHSPVDPARAIDIRDHWAGPDRAIRTAVSARYARGRKTWTADRFGHATPPPHARIDSVTLVLPYWMPTTALALLPAVAAARGVAGRRRRRRAAGGLCPACGYDCRVTSAGGRCPECGAIQGGGMKDEG